MNVSHNKHISLESRNIYKQKHLVIIKFLKSEMDLYSMLYVFHIGIYYYRYFPLEEVNFQY